MAPGPQKTKTVHPWIRYSDEKLLDVRLCDLGVAIAASPLEDRVAELYRDLARRGLKFRPHVWLSSEWFSPKGVPGIGVPFYLVHSRLMRLERTKMLECEGGDRKECVRILRHECGHAIQDAYKLYRRKKWQKLFGRSSKRYPTAYRPNPASRNYVQHLRLYYAQSHPDEDFAETFAVWLRPRSTWKKRYLGWPALKKLEYVDELMEEIKEKPPQVRTRREVDPLHRLRITLREHYENRMRHYSDAPPEIYDRDLKKMFSDDPRHKKRTRASAFLRKNRAEIRRLVARWTGEYQYTLDQVMDDMIDRCRVLSLKAVDPEYQLCMDFAVVLTVQTMHFHYSRKNWIAL